LTKEISDAISLPVIAHGGIGSMNDVEDLLESGIIDSLAIGSALHYEALKNFNLDLNNRKEGNVDFLLSGRSSYCF
jgi:imidazole glycerol phosphate synthase subunit HisF